MNSDFSATCTQDSSAERHAHTVHHPDIRERKPGLSGSWLRYRAQPTSAMAATPRRRSYVGVPVPRDLQEALRRRRAALFNGARDSSRSLIAEREDTDPAPESRSGNDPVKAAATARAFDARLTGFSDFQTLRPSVTCTVQQVGLRSCVMDIRLCVLDIRARI